jgi:hypothetical protein
MVMEELNIVDAMVDDAEQLALNLTYFAIGVGIALAFC